LEIGENKMIYGTAGKLGKGKTLSILLKAYEAYLEGKTVFSNIPLSFPHEPIKTPYDFLSMEKGFGLLDELWSVIDNRRSSSNLNILSTVLLLRSRKVDLDIGYTQQYMQIDARIAFITDIWIKPKCYPFDPEGKIKYKPEILIQERWDSDFNKLPTLKFTDLDPYLSLYDTHKDPYTIQGLLDKRALSQALKMALDEPTKKELKELTNISQQRNKLKELKTL
jgi:hypothetical protein